MIFRLRIIPLMALIVFLLAAEHQACTTAIITGKATADGRPLLWKHRDSDFEQNKVMIFTDGQYRYLGLVNSADSLGREIWAGCNSAGFAIMNSASNNLKPADDSSAISDQEGVVMKRALQSCATVAEFEKMLRDWPKPVGVEANFGVIDAQGGAAYFETNNFNYTKYDANDLQTAPFGYIIRTNHSFSVNVNDGYGYIRYQNAENLLDRAAGMNILSAEYLLTQASRSLKHSLTGADLWQNLPLNDERPDFVWFEDFIPRRSSSASVVVQGVKSGESIELTTMWTILGFPLCSIVVPAWPVSGVDLPGVVTAPPGANAPLCEKAVQLKQRCFPIKRGSGYKYLNRAMLVNQAGDGILQKLQPLEEKIFREANAKLYAWREKGLTAKEIKLFYEWMDGVISMIYKESFDL